jgi:hypothetical protein
MVLPMAMLPPAPFGAPIPVAAMVTPVMSVVTMAARNDLNLIGGTTGAGAAARGIAAAGSTATKAEPSESTAAKAK